MTKRAAEKARKADWQKALNEGRVLRSVDGFTMKSYPTHAMLEADLQAAGGFLVRFHADTLAQLADGGAVPGVNAPSVHPLGCLCGECQTSLDRAERA